MKHRRFQGTYRLHCSCISHGGFCSHCRIACLEGHQDRDVVRFLQHKKLLPVPGIPCGHRQSVDPPDVLCTPKGALCVVVVREAQDDFVEEAHAEARDGVLLGGGEWGAEEAAAALLEDP